MRDRKRRRSVIASKGRKKGEKEGMVGLWEAKRDSKHKVASFLMCQKTSKPNKCWKVEQAQKKTQWKPQSDKGCKKKNVDVGGMFAEWPKIYISRLFDVQWIYKHMSNQFQPYMHLPGSKVSCVPLQHPPRLQLQGSVVGHELSLSADEPDVWNIPGSAASTTIASITNTPLPHSPCLSPIISSPPLCLHFSLHLSILSHCLVMLSVRTRLCHSWRGLLSTSGAQLSSLWVLFLFVCLFGGWGVGLVKGRIWVGMGICACIVFIGNFVCNHGSCLCAFASVCVQVVFLAYDCLSICLNLLIYPYTSVRTFCMSMSKYAGMCVLLVVMFSLNCLWRSLQGWILSLLNDRLSTGDVNRDVCTVFYH